MVNVKSKKSRIESCGKYPSFGVASTKTVESCARRAVDEMVDVISKRCRTEACIKFPSYRVAGTKTAQCCAQHAPVGMVHVKSRKYRSKGYGKQPSFGVADVNPAKYCTQHVRLWCGVKGYKEREVGPHYSGDETIGKVIQSDGEKTVVHPPPTRASALSGGRRVFRKRVRHPDVLPTASKRAVARMSAGTVTMPNIDGETFPVKRDSSVKIQVQLSS